MQISLATKLQISKYEELFYTVFARNANNTRVNFTTKLNSGGHEKPTPIVCLQNEKIIGALTIYPLHFTYEQKTIVGGQIGDAFVLPEHRGKGIFKEMISYAQQWAKKSQYYFLFTFPSIQNPSSLNSFLSNNWIKCQPLTRYLLKCKPSLPARVLRKISKKAYLNLEKRYITDYSSCEGWYEKKNELMSVFDSEFMQFKKYMTNGCFKSRAGRCFISLNNFSLLLSHYELNIGYQYVDLIKELISLASSLAKDTITIICSSTNQMHYEPKDHDYIVDNDLQVLVFKINKTFDEKKLIFRACDLDTF